jgi:hypothetical protein
MVPCRVRGGEHQFVEWWKKLLKALSKAGHAEAGAIAAVGMHARPRSSNHRAPPPSTLKPPKLANLLSLALATLDDQRDGDMETPLWRSVVYGSVVVAFRVMAARLLHFYAHLLRPNGG